MLMGGILAYMKHFHAFSCLALSAALLLFASSCVQISDPASTSSEPTTHSTNFAPTDADAIAGTLTLTMSTASLAGEFAPRNVAVLWVEDDTGAFVKTLGVWAATRKKYLTTWIASQENSTVDGVTGATRSGHTSPLTVTWDGTYTDDTTRMAKGTYLLRGEITDHNGLGETFSVSIDLTGGVALDPPAVTTFAGFPSIDASFTPTP